MADLCPTDEKTEGPRGEGTCPEEPGYKYQTQDFLHICPAPKSAVFLI